MPLSQERRGDRPKEDLRLAANLLLVGTTIREVFRETITWRRTETPKAFT